MKVSQQKAIDIPLGELTDEQRANLERIARISGETLEEAAERTLDQRVIARAAIAAPKKTPSIQAGKYRDEPG